MLSKSAARAFFLGGTVLCGVAFVALTVDSFAKIPGQTNEAALTPAVERGKDLWDHNNCMGCHTLLGEGAYYAPELTRVYERRGPEFIKAMLRDPESMYPGQRKMRNYGFSPQEIDDLVAFLQWVGTMDLNGFPPRPNLAPTPPKGVGVGLAKPQTFTTVCVACHQLGGQGGQVGPALDTVGDKYDEAYLRRWLSDPRSVKPGTKMPKLGLTDAQIDELAPFLAKQKGALP